jgi:tetratricopeptide (TPR) repeat protein
VLQTDPQSQGALTGLVGLELAAGQAARVEARVADAVRRQPDHPGVLMLSARVAMALGQPVIAGSTLGRILDRNPGYVPAALLLADTLARSGRRGEAVRAIERSLERQPASVELRIALARLFEQEGRTDDARALYQRIIADHRPTNATADMLAIVHRTSARLALLYANQGTNLDEALQLASSAKRFLPDDPEMDDAIGWVHVRRRRARIGVPYLDLAVKAQPDNALFRYHLGAAHEQLGNIGAARAELTRALALDRAFPGAADAQALLAKLPG